MATTIPDGLLSAALESLAPASFLRYCHPYRREHGDTPTASVVSTPGQDSRAKGLAEAVALSPEIAGRGDDMTDRIAERACLVKLHG